MVTEQERVRAAFGDLKRAKRYRFPKHNERLEASEEQGVYIIYSPRSERILHVGRTCRGRAGLRQRLNNHLHGASSFTIKHFDGHGGRLRDGYKYGFIAIGDARLRALVEAYAIGLLCPAHLGLSQPEA